MSGRVRVRGRLHLLFFPEERRLSDSGSRRYLLIGADLDAVGGFVRLSWIMHPRATLIVLIHLWPVAILAQGLFHLAR